MKIGISSIIYAMLFVLLIGGYGYSEIPGSFSSNLTDNEQKAYYKLAQDLHGKVAFSRQGTRIKVITIGDTVSQDFGPGKYVRWSPDGTKLAVVNNNNVYVMDAIKNAPQTLLVSGIDNIPNCPIEFHTNGQEILYVKSRKIYAVDINTKNSRLLALPPYPALPTPQFKITPDCDGEIGISADGNRMVYRGYEQVVNGVSIVMPHKVDFTLNYDSLYLLYYDDPNNIRTVEPNGCSTNISPDGSMVMNNTRAHPSTNNIAHKSIMIWNFEATGALIKEIMIPTDVPDPMWDNQHWSNHNDWIAAKGDGGVTESYLINWRSGNTYRVTWEGATNYPDLWVDTTDTTTSVETKKPGSSTSVRTGIQLTNAKGFPLLSISLRGRHDIRVYNILGQLLQTQNGYGPSSYSFPNLRSGLYFIQIKTQLGTSVQKMFIVR
jgi:dipeptidyl aminopeptidase/acylaminoacyl peptidase